MSYRFSGSGTTGAVDGGRTVKAVGVNDAEFTYRVELTLQGRFRLVRPLVGATMKKGLRSDLERLRVILEADDARAMPERDEGDAST
jgi:hypothetical protein